MKKPNYNLKKTILDDDIVLKSYIRYSKIIYLYSEKREESGYTILQYQNANDSINNLIRDFGSSYIRECERLWQSQRQRVSRLRKRISLMLESPCLFLTLTFRDDVLDSTSPETRRLYVSRFLKQFNSLYIGNIDFGDDHFYTDRKGNNCQATKREHYHAILQTDRIDYHLWRYGIINGLKVRNNVSTRKDGSITYESSERISKYISKLTNHAIKETTKGCRIIYSRNFNSLC